jgi:hypothetical protein
MSNTPIPPGFVITYCKTGYARGLDPQRCAPSNKHGAMWSEGDAIERAMESAQRRCAQQQIAVMLTALAAKRRCGQETEAARVMAYDFIFSDSRKFHDLCDVAGKHPDEVQKRARQIMKNGIARPDRAPDGKGPGYHKRKRRAQLFKKAEEIFS